MAQKSLDARFDDPMAHIEPISDDEAMTHISVFLAVRGKSLPDLKDRKGGTSQTDEARHSFARKMVEHMRESRMGLYRTVSERSLMMNTGMAKKE